MSRNRLLVPGLLAEGASDHYFLEPLIVRQLQALLQGREVKATLVMPCETGSVHSTAEPALVVDAARALAERCDVLFLHRDHKEQEEAKQILVELGELPRKAGVPVVLLPKLMTESWVLADRAALADVHPGVDLDAHPHIHPADVEKGNPAHDHPEHPKRVLRAVLRRARRTAPADYVPLLADEVDLSVLSKVPSYQDWLRRTETVLQEKQFLR